MPKGPVKPRTIGELRSSGYTAQSVKQEVRKNLIRKIEKADELFPGIVGFDESVIPQLENAVLAGQDIILLGKTGPGEVPAHSPPGLPAGRRDSGDGRLRA